jgi:hypothetical protein
MSIELITIKELLRDPQYRAYFSKVPKLPSHYTPENKPWKLMVLKRGEVAWRSKRMGTYQEAFEGLKKMLPLITNAAINCPPLNFMPPVRTVRLKGKFDRKGKQVLKSIIWRPAIDADMEAHNWCPHCRRPSIFKVAVTTSKNRGGFAMPASEPALRCMICGASERIVDLRHPENHQKWDPNRPRIY